MKNEQFKSVWDAIEDTPEEAENISPILALARHKLQNYLGSLNREFLTSCVARSIYLA